MAERCFDLVLLTKSTKYKGYCVVGIDVNTGELIRLVSHGALTNGNLTMDNGKLAAPLDVVRVVGAEPCPGRLQSENYQLDLRNRLQYLGTMSIEDLLARHPLSGQRELFRGMGPMMEPNLARGLDYSVELVRVRRLIVRSLEEDGRPRTRADFELAGQRMSGFPVTDPRYFGEAGTTVSVGEAVIVCSIAEDEWARNRGYFKFIAAIYPVKPEGSVAPTRRVVSHARNYLEMLSRGVDPLSEQNIEADSLLMEPRLQKCFAFVSELLGELLDNDGYIAFTGEPVSYEITRKKAPFRLTPEARKNVHISPRPVTPNVFVNSINAAAATGDMERLSVKKINQWLLKNGYVAERKRKATVNRTYLQPLPKAAWIGIRASEVEDSGTGEFKPRLTLDQQAQKFLLDNMEEILKET